MTQHWSIADAPVETSQREAVLEYYLVGCVPFRAMLAWQQQMAYRLNEGPRRRIVVAIGEHPPLVSVGRDGSRAHVLMTGQQLRDRHLSLEWTARGGGCILHRPGQLAVYTLVPLARFGWTVGDLLGRLQQAAWQTVAELAPHALPGSADFGIWGRSGQLVATAIAVRWGVSRFGMYVNVNPPMDDYPLILAPRPFTGFGYSQQTMGCLMAERRQGAKVSQVRAGLVTHLAAVFGIAQYHVYTSHPDLVSCGGDEEHA
ncbi:MAG: hypothetical protein KatS3mg110_4407 [Pirellulaceae bacterium]|nr:MAG: hypothetical protein KatS3mg110_4407 [Pirellulaceae bacterium]